MLTVSWLRSLQRAFGTPFLLLVFSVYWTQGFRSFPWTGINVLMKDELKLGPAAAQLMTSTAYIPWSVKPIYGIVSDCIPIRGQRRVPYIFIANILTLVPWIILATVKVVTESLPFFTILLVCQNVGAAMADVVVDAMVAESTKKDKEVYAGDLQALSWFSMAVGGILGSLLGGPALHYLKPNLMFGLFALCPLGQLAFSLFTNERSLVSDGLDEEVGQAESSHVAEQMKPVDPGNSGRSEHQGKLAGVNTRKLNGMQEKGFLQAMNDEPAESWTCEHLPRRAGNRLEKDEPATGKKNLRLAGTSADEATEAAALLPSNGAETLGEITGLPGKKPNARLSFAQTSMADGAQAEKSAIAVDDASPGASSMENDNTSVMIKSESEVAGLRRRSVATSTDGKLDLPAREAQTANDGKSRRGDEEAKAKWGKGREVKRLWHKMVMVGVTLWEAVLNPEIHRPMLWFMASCALVPSLQTTMFYFQTNELQLEMSFLGTAKVVGWGGLMLGTFVYNSKLKYVPMRRIFRWVHVISALLTLTDVLLTSRLNLRLGIPDRVFVLGASALGDAIFQFRFMPFLILSARLCPPGIEGTLFALFMSAYNFGNTLSGYMGATLASRLGITSSSFSNLTLAVAIQSACNVFPILLLSFVPANMSGAGDEKHLVREVSVSPKPAKEKKRKQRGRIKKKGELSS